ncbi:lipocalin family protein [Cohnella sp. WQ 127256]|uniref:lipocalin family protein n=1 Tax=Cohnella sp. WQ 127256 TaxID=2938790 RepID=UPI002118002B|nr:lipocalin family protein [Cohnella sp. WQ 127256]
MNDLRATLISIPKDAAAHPEANLEWWYCYAFINGSGGRRYALMISFFRVGELSRIKGHYLIYSLIRLDEPGFISRSYLDRSLFYHMTGLYLPSYFLFKPSDWQTWEQYGTLFKGKLPTPHSWIKDISMHSQPTAIQYGHAGITFIDDVSQQFTLHIDDPEVRVDLTFTPSKPLTAIDEQGTLNGLYYYSSTRNTITGHIHHEGGTDQVSGEGWFDHQWGRNYELLKGEGWNWFGLQLDDGRELLINQLHAAKSATTPSSPTAILILKDQASISINNIKMRPLRVWRSFQSGMSYPVEWYISIPDYQLELHVIPAFDNQEMLIIGPIRAIWEGACLVTGLDHSNNTPINGKGFVELAGFAKYAKA